MREDRKKEGGHTKEENKRSDEMRDEKRGGLVGLNLSLGFRGAM